MVNLSLLLSAIILCVTVWAAAEGAL
jgi:nitrogen fixation-related uncharacterized protein